MKRTYRIVERRVVFEMGPDEPHEHASTQAVPPDDIVELVKKAQEAIDPEDLHEDGFGPPPHITILYGLGDEDKDAALEVMRGAGRCRARVRGVDLFEGDEYDVVIFAVESEDLARLRDEIDKAAPDNMNEWPEYKPHMTVAYVLPGKGEAYKNLESDLVGREFDLDALEFSGTGEGDVERVELGVPAATEAATSPLFGTDILAGKDPGTEAAVREALYPVLNRSNRRIVSVAEDDSGVSVLLDDGQNLVLNRGPDTGPRESWLVTHNGEQFDTADLAAIESLVKRLKSPTTEQEGPDDFDLGPEEIGRARSHLTQQLKWVGCEIPKQVSRRGLSPYFACQATVVAKQLVGRTFSKGPFAGQTPTYAQIFERVLDTKGVETAKRVILGRPPTQTLVPSGHPWYGDPLVSEREAIRFLQDNRGWTDSQMVQLFSLRKQNESFQRSVTTEQEEPDDWQKFGEPPEPAPDVDAPPEEPKKKRRRAVPRVPQSKLVTMTNDGFDLLLVVDQPTGTARGRRFDRVARAVRALEADPRISKMAIPKRRGVNSVVVDIHDKTARQFYVVVSSIKYVLSSSGFEVSDQTRLEPRPGLLRRAGRYVRGLGGLRLVRDDVDEDTYTSDVGFTDTIPITRTRRRKVKLPGLKRAPKKRRVKRRYKVGESMSKGTSPILIVLRPQQVEALSAKPVWSALQESGVISTKGFKMGEEDFFEVSIDTLRKEWSQANAGVLLDEVGSIDPRIQRKVMEGIDADKLVDVVRTRLPAWCDQVPVDLAVKESESFAEAHRARRLEGKAVDEEWARAAIASDPGVVARVLEWYSLSRDVLQRLASIETRREGEDLRHVGTVKAAAKRLLEQETTDTAAGMGGAGAGMPTANAAGATIQGYSEQEPEGVSVSSRNWPAQGMFKIHVLVGETPQWVYRQVVGHEGEGEESMLVYRTPEGRVMRMPHEQIDAAAGFGAVVTPEELAGAEPGEMPTPVFQPPPESSPEPPPELPAVSPPVGEQADPNQERLARDANFGRALAKYQQSKDARDWEDVRSQAERVTGLKGPELDAALAPMAAEKENRQPMYGGAYEDIIPPVMDEDELDEREKKTKQVKGRKVKEPTHMRALAKKAGVGMDRAMKAWGEAQLDFEKAHPEVKKKSDRYYKGVTGYFKKKIGLDRKGSADEEDDRQAEAVRMFSADDRFHEMMDKFERTRNEGYLIRAAERASRVAGIPLNEARNLVDEILEVAKKGV